MSMKVYLSGGLVYVEKTGQPVLTIPQNRAIYTFVGQKTNVVGDLPDVFTNVFIQDRLLLSAENDTLANIIDGSDAVVGDYNAILKYLSGFIPLGNSFFLEAESEVTVSSVSTAENQVEQIEIENKNFVLSSIILKNIADSLNEIKKLLTKMYQ